MTAVERMTVRRARKERPCSDEPYCRHGHIQPGDLYAEHVTGPGHDILGNTGWRRAAECSHCYEERTGRVL